jgi:uncharacterized protein YraI
LVLAATVSVAEASFPYTAKVNSKAVVRSGAGEEYYETDKLAKGDEVEVHEHDGDGWCAMRPPANSFSWVPARYVKVGSPEVPASVGVVQKRVASRIGSNLSAARSAVSVYLEPGELVEIVELVEGGSKPWYKILPPSGEFRWIHKRFLAGAELADAEPSPPAKKSIEADDKAETAEAPAKPKQEWTSKSASVARQRSSQPAKSDSNPPASKSTATASRTKSDPVTDKSANSTEEKPKEKENESPKIAVQLVALNLRLSGEVAREPHEWDLDPLRDEAKQLLQAATLVEDRTRAESMLQRIARFDDLRRRRETTDQVASAIPSAAKEVAKGEPIEDDPRFDGTGKLVAIHSNKPEAPQYALTDEENRVVILISPSPGVNLQAHVGSQVGIRGIRGYAPGVDKPHLTAQRVTSLGPR